MRIRSTNLSGSGSGVGIVFKNRTKDRYLSVTQRVVIPSMVSPRKVQKIFIRNRVRKKSSYIMPFGVFPLDDIESSVPFKVRTRIEGSISVFILLKESSYHPWFHPESKTGLEIGQHRYDSVERNIGLFIFKEASYYPWFHPVDVDKEGFITILGRVRFQTGNLQIVSLQYI